MLAVENLSCLKLVPWKYEDGEAGADQHENDVNEYVDRDFDDAGTEVRSLDQRERKVGLFGDWLEVGGHGKCVEWVQDQETALYTLEVVREENGTRRGSNREARKRAS